VNWLVCDLERGVYLFGISLRFTERVELKSNILFLRSALIRARSAVFCKKIKSKKKYNGLKKING